MKCLERIVEGVLRPIVNINGAQFGFVPWRGTFDNIFMVRQLQKAHSRAIWTSRPCHRCFTQASVWEDLYTDDLVIIAESIEECVRWFLV